MTRSVLLLCLMLLPGCAQRAVFTPPDGHWWLSASAAERDGFEIGFEDCSIYRQGDEFPTGISRFQVEGKVTDFYTQHPTDLDLAVVKVLANLEAEWRRTGAYHFAHAKPENEYDGENWRQGSAHGSAQRDGMIRGFLACKLVETSARVRVPVAEIIDRVSKWYGIDPHDEGVANEKTVNDKLGPVILRAVKEPVKR